MEGLPIVDGYGGKFVADLDGEPLLRALVTIRPRPESRLYLQRAAHGRPPEWRQRRP